MKISDIPINKGQNFLNTLLESLLPLSELT